MDKRIGEFRWGEFGERNIKEGFSEEETFSGMKTDALTLRSEGKRGPMRTLRWEGADGRGGTGSPL